MGKSYMTKSAEEIAGLIDELRKRGELNGRIGEYVVFDQNHRLIQIVNQAGLRELLEFRSDIGGWQRIDGE